MGWGWLCHNSGSQKSANFQPHTIRYLQVWYSSHPSSYCTSHHSRYTIFRQSVPHYANIHSDIKIFILRNNSQHSSASFITRLQARLTKTGVQITTKTEIFLLTTTFKLGVWPTEAPKKWEMGVPSSVFKQSGHKARYSPQNNNKDKTGVIPPISWTFHGMVFN